MQSMICLLILRFTQFFLNPEMNHSFEDFKKCIKFDIIWTVYFNLKLFYFILLTDLFIFL